MIDDKMFQERVARLNAITAPDAAECCVEDEDSPQSLTFLRWLGYPLNGPGLSIIVIYVVVPFLLWAFFMVMPGALQFAGILVLIITRCLIGLSTLWYLTVCIRASGEGQIKPPTRC